MSTHGIIFSFHMTIHNECTDQTTLRGAALMYCIADAESCIYIVKGREREVGGGAGYGYFTHQTTQ